MDTEDKVVIPTPSLEELKPTIPYMRNLIRMSKIINMWPDTRKNFSFSYHFKVWLISTYYFSMIVSFVVAILENITNLVAAAVIVDFGTVYMSGTFRYIYVYVRRDKYLLLVSLIHNNFIEYSLFPKENRSSLLKYYKFANKLIVAYAIFIFFWVLQICFSPLIIYIWKISRLPSDLNETLVEPIEYPVLIKTYSPFNYYTQPGNVIFYVYQFIGYALMCLTYVAVDCFWYMVIFLAVGQFALLKDSVDTISEILNKADSVQEHRQLKKDEIQHVTEGLKHCIRRHQFSREFVRLVEDLLSPVVLADTVHVLISVAFMLFDSIIALRMGDVNRSVYSLEYFITSIAHMFFFNWLGNELAFQEEELADTISKIPWYKCQSEKHLLMIMSLQARKPYKLTGGRMFALSLDFFMKTLKAVFSVFTFLQNMKT